MILLQNGVDFTNKTQQLKDKQPVKRSKHKREHEKEKKEKTNNDGKENFKDVVDRTCIHHRQVKGNNGGERRCAAPLPHRLGGVFLFFSFFVRISGNTHSEERERKTPGGRHSATKNEE